MKKALHISFLFLLCFLSLPALAQERQVTGEVKDEEGFPIPGVSVVVKGTSQGTVTDFEGNYALSVPGDNAILVFSYLGMKPQEIEIGSNTSVDVVLESEVYSLDEVVAIGYGRAKKKDISGSISTVDGATIAERNTTQVTQALQGTMPGVMVTRTNSEPGAGGSIRVRGITTIGDSAPLVVVDGVPVASLDDVNADDIQDISVLKDAASASIYGARAAAGVILITTKRAAVGKSSLNYKVSYGIDKPTVFPEMVDTQRYLQMINEFTWNDAGNPEGGEFPLYSEDEVNNWASLHQQDPNRTRVRHTHRCRVHLRTSNSRRIRMVDAWVPTPPG